MLPILLVFLGASTYANTGDKREWAQQDIHEQGLPFVREFEIHSNECNWWLSRLGEDMRVVMFGGLAPLRGAKPCVPAKNDPVKDDNMDMIQGKVANGHLVGDHVAPIRNGLIFLRNGDND